MGKQRVSEKALHWQGARFELLFFSELAYDSFVFVSSFFWVT